MSTNRHSWYYAMNLGLYTVKQSYYRETNPEPFEKDRTPPGLEYIFDDSSYKRCCSYGAKKE